MDVQSQDDPLEPTNSSSVPIRNIALRTCRKQWTIGRGGERGSGISLLITRHNDDDVAYMKVRMFVVEKFSPKRDSVKSFVTLPRKQENMSQENVVQNVYVNTEIIT